MEGVDAVHLVAAAPEEAGEVLRLAVAAHVRQLDFRQVEPGATAAVASSQNALAVRGAQHLAALGEIGGVEI